MNHYCTYFDRGFLIQGLALWRSLQRHDPDAQLWVLALDEFSAALLRALGEAALRVVRLDELEAADPALGTAKENRMRVEYYFTLSPCWPRYLLAHQPRIDRITYLDADLFFFADPAPIFARMDAMGASVLITAHRFPSWLQHYERHGRFNVGILSFRNDAVGCACLDDWRERCLAWCHHRLEGEKYADQKYLDAWPQQFGSALFVLDHPGVNHAPWNWAGHHHTWDGSALPLVDGETLIVFHFARFRPTHADRRWQSGQLDYGVMPRRLRNAIYGPYWRALTAAGTEIVTRRPGFDFPARPTRLGRAFWRAFPLRLFFGGDWFRLGDRFYNARFGFGRFSGRALAVLRRLRLRGEA